MKNMMFFKTKIMYWNGKLETQMTSSITIYNYCSEFALYGMYRNGNI